MIFIPQEPPKMTATLRLALRVEGDKWNAYLAKSGTMERSVLIGSIVFVAVRDNPDLKAGFMELMQGAMAALLKSCPHPVEIDGWEDPIPAPPHERSGNA
jgi:hypothetical protein